MNTTVPQTKPETAVPPLSASTSGPQPEEISAKTQAFFLNSHPGRLFLWMAIPGAVSMLASSLYVFLDGIFVGRLLGNEAFAALNFVFPLVILNFAIADLVGVGSSVPTGIFCRKRCIFRQFCLKRRTSGSGSSPPRRSSIRAGNSPSGISDSHELRRHHMSNT